MSTKPKILYLASGASGDEPELQRLGDRFEVVRVQSPVRALMMLSRQASNYAGVYVASEHLREVLNVGRLLQNERILQGMPDGVALVDVDNTILWANARLKQWCRGESIIGLPFFKALDDVTIEGNEFAPLTTALATKSPAMALLRSGTNRFFRLHAAPVLEGDGEPRSVIVTLHDVTQETLQRQKLEAIHRAGIELANLTANDLCQMSVDDRIDLLKGKILQQTQDLLNFDVVEIRLIDQKTGRLEPLLASGMTPEAVARELYPSKVDNGVTGYVAAMGTSYLCDDTTNDPLYLVGCTGAKSSLTVPLKLHDVTIGTFNVESPKPCAFTENDVVFLEIYCREIARALNTLELLTVEKVTAAAESVEMIHRAVALPVDEILNEAVNIMERYIGHDPDVVDRLQKILRNARNIKQDIQKVGQQMAPIEALPQAMQSVERPRLRNLRVLVVDADTATLAAAHAILDRYGCVVETSHCGGECLNMVRGLGVVDAAYDVIIADIRLPDWNGYELLCRLQGALENVPLALMTGFGYDPGHSIVKARQAGVKHILFKPFRVDQLLDAVEAMAESPRPAGAV